MNKYMSYCHTIMINNHPDLYWMYSRSKTRATRGPVHPGGTHGTPPSEIHPENAAAA